MQVTDEQIKTALEAFNKAINEPELDTCPRCKGTGVGHVLGENGYEPDWCIDCGGGGYHCRPGEELRAMRAALEAI